MTDLSEVAPAFIGMAHSIVWATAATVDTRGRPRTRVLHPIWEFDGDALTGWIATGPQSLKAKHLAAMPEMSLTYWAPNHDTCTADCATAWESSATERRAGWERFSSAPEPVGYDPGIIPGWTDPDTEAFGILRLEPRALRVMPGTVMLKGAGDVLTWPSD